MRDKPLSQAVYIVDDATYMAKGYMKLRDRSEEKVKKNQGEVEKNKSIHRNFAYSHSFCL